MDHTALLVMAPRTCSVGGQLTVGCYVDVDILVVHGTKEADLHALSFLGQRLPLKVLEELSGRDPGHLMLDILQFVHMGFWQQIPGARSILYHWPQELRVGVIAEIC